jgi:hypothetical protein
MSNPVQDHVLALDHLLEQLAAGVFPIHVELQCWLCPRPERRPRRRRPAISATRCRQALSSGAAAVARSARAAPVRFSASAVRSRTSVGSEPARPRARPRLDQAILFQPLQRIADGQDAHAELLSQPPARQRRAGPQLSAQDLVPNREVSLVGETHRHMHTRGSVANGPREVKRTSHARGVAQARPAAAAT